MIFAFPTFSPEISVGEIVLTTFESGINVIEFLYSAENSITDHTSFVTPGAFVQGIVESKNLFFLVAIVDGVGKGEDLLADSPGECFILNRSGPDQRIISKEIIFELYDLIIGVCKLDEEFLISC